MRAWLQAEAEAEAMGRGRVRRGHGVERVEHPSRAEPAAGGILVASRK